MKDSIATLRLLRKILTTTVRSSKSKKKTKPLQGAHLKEQRSRLFRRIDRNPTLTRKHNYFFAASLAACKRPPRTRSQWKANELRAASAAAATKAATGPPTPLPWRRVPSLSPALSRTPSRFVPLIHFEFIKLIQGFPRSVYHAWNGLVN